MDKMDISRDDSRETNSKGEPILISKEKKEIADREFDEGR